MMGLILAVGLLGLIILWVAVFLERDSPPEFNSAPALWTGMLMVSLSVAAAVVYSTTTG